jgi:hypothetical protein
MGLGSYLKRVVGAIAFAAGSVEKSALSQGEGANLGAGTQQHRRLRQGSLADSLNQGIVNEQVQELRWRMYKLLEESQNYKTVVVGENEDGTYITETIKFDHSEKAASILNKVKIDDFDDYTLELVVNNDEVPIGTLEGMNDINANSDDIILNYDANGKLISATHGEVNGEADQSANKSMRPIECTREFRQKFEIENFTRKMNVRLVSESERLLEFYVSKYPDEYNRKSRFFISEIIKAMKNPRMCDFLEINTVNFVSYNTLGVKDLHEFEYRITKFDKIIEFDGYYVIKFKAEITKNGESLYDKYNEGAEKLIEKYDKKIKRDQK